MFAATKRFPLVFALFFSLLVAAASFCKSMGYFSVELYHIEKFVGGDKVLHSGFSFLISLFWLLAASDALYRFRVAALPFVHLLLFLAFTLDEFLQLLFLPRTFSFGDLAVNYSGLLIASAFVWLLRHPSLPLLRINDD